jgi:hypothetical protein
MVDDADKYAGLGLTEAEIEALKEDGGGEETTTEEVVEDLAATETVEELVQEEPIEIEPTIEGPLKARAPQNAGELLGQLDAEEEALAAKFDEGDITTREYREGMRKLSAQREDLNWQSRKADLAAEMDRNVKERAWNDTVAEFMTTTAAPITSSRAMMTGFDSVVRQITAMPEYQKLSDKKQLEAAWKIFNDETEKAAGMRFDRKAAPKAEPAPAPKAAPRDKEGRFVPPTLAKVPASDAEDMDGGKYAALDRMAEADPIAYENMLSRMPKGELDAYLAAR